MPPAKWTLAIIATLVSSAVSVLSVHAQSQPADPQHVVQAFQLAIAAGDVEAALAQFADDAVVTVQARSSRSYTGKDQVRAYLQTTALQLRTLTRSTPIVQGGIVTWSERAQFQREAFAFDVSILATVRSSRITSLVYRQGTPANGPSAAAEPAPMQLPSLTWPAAIALIGLLLLGVVFGRPRRPASHSRLDGRLLLELRRQHGNERHNRAA